MAAHMGAAVAGRRAGTRQAPLLMTACAPAGAPAVCRSPGPPPQPHTSPPHVFDPAACADEDDDSEDGGAGGGGGGRGRSRGGKKGKAADAASIKATREKARRERLNEWCVPGAAERMQRRARVGGTAAVWLLLAPARCGGRTLLLQQQTLAPCRLQPAPHRLCAHNPSASSPPPRLPGSFEELARLCDPSGKIVRTDRISIVQGAPAVLCYARCAVLCCALCAQLLCWCHPGCMVRVVLLLPLPLRAHAPGAAAARPLWFEGARALRGGAGAGRLLTQCASRLPARPPRPAADAIRAMGALRVENNQLRQLNKFLEVGAAAWPIALLLILCDAPSRQRVAPEQPASARPFGGNSQRSVRP